METQLKIFKEVKPLDKTSMNNNERLKFTVLGLIENTPIKKYINESIERDK